MAGFKVRYLFVHTAADPREAGQYDTSAAEIERWHRARGFDGIGYHYVVRRSGLIEPGRAVSVPGAHVRGMNHCSLGICLSGHHDLVPMTDAQHDALIRLLKELMTRYGLPAHRVLGHREVNQLVLSGQLDPIYRTAKSCPGRFVDMKAIRLTLYAQEGGVVRGWK